MLALSSPSTLGVDGCVWCARGGGAVQKLLGPFSGHFLGKLELQRKRDLFGKTCSVSVRIGHLVFHPELFLFRALTSWSSLEERAEHINGGDSDDKYPF